ncbi:hypothetical protein [Massilia sp. TSP1-1-2]|uniref:hypothetical protein n=1 Tax=unclassified Massilia TaxID=2609279 RepID=UPI003CF5C680
MTTQQASPSYCMKINAVMAAIWGALLAFVLGNGWFTSIDLERPLHVLILGSSLAIVAVAIPALRDAELRNPASIAYLVVGILLLGATAALIALSLFTILLSGWNMNSHR